MKNQVNHSVAAGELFLQGCNCAQAVFASFCDLTGYNFDEALRLSSPFGGGMGRLREVCGACSAVFLVAGALYGYGEHSDEAKAKLYARVQELAERFKDANGSYICRDLLGISEGKSSPEPSVRDDNYYKTRPCLRFVKSAAALLDDFVRENGAANGGKRRIRVRGRSRPSRFLCAP